MELFKVSKVIPNIIDIVLLTLIALSVYFKNIPVVSLPLLIIPCLAMVALIIRQVIDCWKQKSIYNFTMLATAASLKIAYSNKLMQDIIIYGLHFYLYSLNPNPIYLVCFGLCMVYDLLIYNAAFNPLMRQYVVNTVMRQVENEHRKKSD